MTVTIYHNPNCGTSREVLAMIGDAGETPEIIEYLKTPPSREKIKSLARRAGVGVRHFVRQREAAYAELGLADPAIDDEALLDAIEAHPNLLNRPIVETPRGVRLCRPKQLLLEIL